MVRCRLFFHHTMFSKLLAKSHQTCTRRFPSHQALKLAQFSKTPCLSVVNTTCFGAQQKCSYSTIESIKELRRMTDAPLGHCKKAIAECDGNIEEAKKWLQKQGIKTARKKAGRTAAEGLIGVALSEDHKSGVLIELNCETDFSGNTEVFRSVAHKLAKHAASVKANTNEELLSSSFGDHGTVADELINVTSKIGENVNLRRVHHVKAPEGGTLVSYIHNSTGEGVGEIGVIVSLHGEGDAIQRVGRQICMQIAAMNPQYISMDNVPESLKEEQRQIETESYKRELAESGKKSPPDNIVEKIINGKVQKKLSEDVLLEQEFIMDPKKNVQQALPEAKVETFVKFRVGDGIEKVQTNLADEVSKQAGL